MGNTHYELTTEEVQKIIENEANVVIDNNSKEQVHWGVYGVEDEFFDNVYVRYTEMDRIKWVIKINTYATHICAYKRLINDNIQDVCASKPHLYWSGRVFIAPQSLKDLGIEHK